MFIDGNNWYHSLREIGIEDLGRLKYAKVSRKLLGPRAWLGTRYYIGQVGQRTNPRLHADQRRFLAGLTAEDSRITVHLGRLERRPASNPVAVELASYLGGLRTRLDGTVYRDLVTLSKRHSRLEIFVEKAVDVMLAVDLVMLAARDAYDAAYLLTRDGDFTPAVEAVRGLGKNVYAASPGYGAQLAASVSSFIRLPASWFTDCI